MSYDVHFEADLGGPEPVGVGDLSANHTSNTGAMISEASGLRMRDWDGKTGAEVLVLANRALADLTERADHYEAMNPANGWGSRASTVQFLSEIRDAAVRVPKAIFKVWS